MSEVACVILLFRREHSLFSELRVKIKYALAATGSRLDWKHLRLFEEGKGRSLFHCTEKPWSET